VLFLAKHFRDLSSCFLSAINLQFLENRRTQIKNHCVGNNENAHSPYRFVVGDSYRRDGYRLSQVEDNVKGKTIRASGMEGVL